jgi:hypothetical protein
MSGQQRYGCVYTGKRCSLFLNEQIRVKPDGTTYVRKRLVIRLDDVYKIVEGGLADSSV